MRLRGAICGAALSLTVVAVYGAIEGFQGGFAMDQPGGACAGSLKAATGSALFHVLHPHPVTLTVMILSAILGATAGATIAASYHQPRDTGNEGLATSPKAGSFYVNHSLRPRAGDLERP